MPLLCRVAVATTALVLAGFRAIEGGTPSAQTGATLEPPARAASGLYLMKYY
jgi:hypothetical protein